MDLNLGGIWDEICALPDTLLNNLDLVAFLVLAAIMLASAICVVASKEVVHSALYLALTFVCVAVTYFFLEAEFIGAVQLMVYVGAITVIFAFSIMLTRRRIMTECDTPRTSRSRKAVGILLGLAMVAVLFGAIFDMGLDLTMQPGIDYTSGAPGSLAEAIFEKFGALLLVVGLLLFGAIIGGAVVSKEEDYE